MLNVHTKFEKSIKKFLIWDIYEFLIWDNKICISYINLPFIENTLKLIYGFFIVFNNISSTTFHIRDGGEEPQHVFSRAGRSMCICVASWQAPHILWALALPWVGRVGAIPRNCCSSPICCRTKHGHWPQTKQSSHTWPHSPGLCSFYLLPLLVQAFFFFPSLILQQSSGKSSTEFNHVIYEAPLLRVLALSFSSFAGYPLYL